MVKVILTCNIGTGTDSQLQTRKESYDTIKINKEGEIWDAREVTFAMNAVRLAQNIPPELVPFWGRWCWGGLTTRWGCVSDGGWMMERSGWVLLPPGARGICRALGSSWPGVRTSPITAGASAHKPLSCCLLSWASRWGLMGSGLRECLGG